jgi:tetratricopeptide (TPR) repeat protein
MQQKTKKQKPVQSTDARQKSRIAGKQQKPATTAPRPSYTRFFVIAAILTITLIAYLPSLQNDLLKTWDDQAYVTNNSLVKSLSAENILKIFKEDKGTYANYHPLTTLSLAVNYHFSKEDPFAYHLSNLLLHLLNTLLVFIFIWLLTKKNLEIAAVAALLFGLNPIHVESVAWISERKDVLYAFFFLASLIAYQQFLKRSDWKLYALSLLLFLCSMLSKAMAASLPLVLILIGFMEKRRWSWKLLPDKIPYLVVAFLLGLYAVRIQAEGNAIGSIIFPFGMRLLHACYGFTTYLLKIAFPIGLSAFYPYPYPLINASWITNNIPAVFYLTLLAALAIFCFSVWCLATNRKNLQVTGFGLLFYAVTIALVLQFLPVGRAIMADRYAYIPGIGLCFIIGHFASLLYQSKTWKIPVVVVFVIYAGFLFFQTREQTKVWKNDGALWSNVIRLYPSDNRIAIAYANRAQFLQAQGKPGEALQDLLLVAGWNNKDDNALDRIGKIYGKEMHDLESSVRYFQQAYLVNPKNLDVLIDLATVYGIKGDYNKSLEYTLKALEIDNHDATLLYNAGITYSNLGQKALGKEYMEKAIKIDPSLKQK